MRIIIDDADQNDFNELAKLARAGKINTFSMTDDKIPQETSEWVLDSDNIPICKKCGEIALQRIFVKMPHLIQDVRMVRSNYCPNCGSKMKGRFVE